MNNRFDDTFMGRLIKAWPLIVGIIVFIYGVGLMAAIVRADHEDVVKLNSRIPELSKKDQEMEVRLIRVEDAITHLSEMKDDMKAIRRNLEKK